uniref:Uncharacterized protein n=1 Tax=Caulobacter sp. (strain K31) TaxID=366602 RepID=B0SZV4_CAUSK
MAWKEIASELVWDGAWRDIYVVGTTIADWQRILDLLNDRTPDALAFYVDGEALSSAPSADVIFERRQETSTLLQVSAGNVHLNCHFFCEEEIEFDLDPRELREEHDLQAVLAFMSTLANGTGKPAILTHENSQEAVILTVQPGS